MLKDDSITLPSSLTMYVSPKPTKELIKGNSKNKVKFTN